LPSSTLTYSLGSSDLRWKEAFFGPSTINLRGDAGPEVKIGANGQGVAYIEPGLATQFLNIGGLSNFIPGSRGGWYIGPTGLQGTSNYDIGVIERDVETGGLTGPWYSLTKGLTGSADGPTGPVGPTGPTGPTGSEGPRGAIGPKGATGLEGPTGSQGEKGEKGEKGEEGQEGCTGPTGLRGAIGPKGATGQEGPTGPEGPVDPTPILGGATGPIGSVSSIITNSPVGTFIQQLTYTTSSITEKVLLQAQFNFITNSDDYELAATIGRGYGPPTSQFLNLANNVPFSTTEVALAETFGSVQNLNTSLAQTFVKQKNKGSFVTMNIVDSPGQASTFTYAVRLLGSQDPNALFVRQNYLYALRVAK
jgi:hypothetical protein